MAWVKDPSTGLEVWVKGAPEAVQAPAEPGLASKAWEAVNTPLLPAATHAAGLPSMGEAINTGMDQLAADELRGRQERSALNADLPEAQLARKLAELEMKGIRGGMRGLGAVLEGLTSPLNLGLTGAGAGAAAAEKGVQGALAVKDLVRAAKLAKLAGAARAGEAVMSAPVAAEGIQNVISGETPGEKALGALELAGGGLGLAHGLGGAVRGVAEAGAIPAAEEALAGATAVGRPLTRKRFQMWLLEHDVPGNELTGKSATQLRAMIEAKGGDPTKLVPLEEMGPGAGETLMPTPEAPQRVNGEIPAPETPTPEMPTGEVPEPAAPGPAPKQPTRAEIAWHPELGTVQVITTRGEEALVQPERGRTRIVNTGTLKKVPPEALEPGIVDVEKPAPEIGGKAQLTEAEKAEYGLDRRAAEPGVDFEQRTVSNMVPEGQPLPPTTENQPVWRGLLVAKEGLHAGPVVDGEQYEVRITDPRIDAPERDVVRAVGSGPVGERLIRLINGMTGQLNEYAGKVMANVPGLSAREATGLAVSPFRGFIRERNIFGRNYHFMYEGEGGFNIDPWSLAQYADQDLSARWSEDLLYKHLPEDLKARVSKFRGQSIDTLPPELKTEVQASLWLARLRQTVVHEPIHNVVGAEHTPAGAVNVGLTGNVPATGVTPDRFDVLFKNVLKIPEVWDSPEYRAMQSPNLRPELVKMYETFRTSADGSPPGTPPPAPPPPGEPPRPSNPVPPGPLTPEDQLKVKLRTMFAAQRIGRVEQNMKNVALHAAQARILEGFRAKVLSGEMTATEAQMEQMKALEGLATRFNTVGVPKFTPAEVENVQQTLARAPWTASIFAKMRAARAFERALRGEQLQEAEIKLLSGFFPKTVAGYEPGVFRQIAEQLLKLHGSLRALVTSWDLSAAGRQGLLLTVGHPVQAAKAFGAQLKAFASEPNFKMIEQSIFNNPMRQLQEAAGLHLSMPQRTVLQTGMGLPEEMFSNATYAEKIWGVRASERAYITYLNKMRSEVFNKVAYEMMRNGKTIESHPQEFVDLAKAINTMSGRGSIEAMYISPASPMGKALKLTEAMELGARYGEPAVPLLNIGFFAPRFMASRLAMLRDLPTLYTNYSGPARQLLLRDVGLTIGAGMSALTLAKAMGADVELDPRSSDFGKVRIGKTRYDPWGGFQPWVRFWAQMQTMQRKPIRSGYYGMEPVSRLELLYRFGEQKLSPSVGAAVDYLRGKQFTGDQLDFLHSEFPYVGKSVWSRVFPLVAQDIYDVAQQGDLEQLLLTVPASTLGVGVQTINERRYR